MKNQHALLLLLTFIFLQNIQSQNGVIYLANPSFEGQPRAGDIFPDLVVGWSSCGFEGETAPDVHSGKSGFFNVTTAPHHGDTYLGMVARDNNTWEQAGQKLSEPMKGGTEYFFSIYLARSLNYTSPSRMSGKLTDYTTPCVLRIYGGKNKCEKNTLLAESPLVTNFQWKEYEFLLSPNEDVDFLTFEIFYKTPTLQPYNGNLLLDHASPLVPTTGDLDSLRANINYREEEPVVLLVQDFEYEDSIFGKKFQLFLHLDDLSVEKEPIVEKTLARAKTIEKNVGDDLAKLYENAGKNEMVDISDDLMKILSFAKKAYRTSSRKFDVTTGGLRQFWHEAAAKNTLPSRADIKGYVNEISHSDLVISKSGVARLRRSGLRLDLDELVTGYILDEMAKVLLENGCQSFQLKRGDFMVCRDVRLRRKMWEYEQPRYFEGKYGKDKKKFTNANIVTVGAQAPLLEFEGNKYYDFIDPETGMAVTKKNIISIQSSSCMEAVAWARALATDYNLDLHLKIKKEKVDIWASHF